VNDAMKVTLMDDAMKAALIQHKKQIAQSEDSANKDKPKEAAFLSDKDRSFDRQTVSRNVNIFNKAGKGNAAINQAAQKPEASQKPEVARKKPLLKDLKLSDIGTVAMDKAEPQPNRAPASVSTQGLDNGDPLSNGLSATNDYVEEVALGDFTHLNTVEYKFYGFYHRIRQKLEQFWGRSIQEKAHTLFRSGRRLPASQDLITSLQITMNEKGEIIKVKVLGASGVKELDDAAIESFNQAGPFPNPPKDLLVNGKAVIEWGFVVKS
jgi:protein TonB